jgi:transposase
MSKKKATDEEIIAALLQGGTIRKAAEALGISERTIYARMNDKLFRQRYQEARNDILRGAVWALNDKITEAVDTISGVMRDGEASPAVRLQAAQAILAHAVKLSVTIDQRDRDTRTQIFDFE